ncbi:MAG: response regulator, partial [Prevotella sp.]|nr:response regulator [Prevotella sp.]
MTILWADDEIDLLKPHMLFLKSKGYDVVTANNGRDAISLAEKQPFDLIILDENMPGLTGLETLSQMKLIAPTTPVIMITKSEEENIMNQAIGNKIADYLIKPVNPNQILLSIKKNLHSDQLVADRASTDYRQEFGKISMQIDECRTFADWCDLYGRIVYWELELSTTETNMDEMLQMQKTDANAAFAKWVKRNYDSWMSGKERPVMSNDIFKTAVFPLLDKGEKVFFILIDNFRLDQWRTIAPQVADMFNIDENL